MDNKMAKAFKGFTEQQTEKIARKLGFNGPMSDINKFLQADPSAASKFARMSEKARQIVEQRGTEKAYNSGGTVTSSTTSTTTDDKEMTSDVTPFAKPSDVLEQKIERTSTTGVLPAAAQAAVPKIEENPDQLIDPNTGKLPTQAPQTQTPTIEGQIEKAASTYDPTVISDKVSEKVGDLEAAQGGPSQEATVQGQLSSLYEDFGPDGTEIPPWAAGAIRTANEAMAARGLGSSSLAGQAITQAAMEAALPIAQQDAQTYAAFEQADLQREQEVRIAEFQAQIESLFSDQAAENAAAQFNAQSENQLKTFYSELAQGFTLARASLELSTDQFNANMENARAEFNSKNALAISQANAQWRQRIAETNTAIEAATNQLNAQLVAQRSNAGFEAMIMLERDEMSYLNEAFARAHASGENYLDRQTQILLSTMGRDLNRELSEDDAWASAFAAAGQAGVKILTSDIGGDIIDGVSDFIGGFF